MFEHLKQTISDQTALSPTDPAILNRLRTDFPSLPTSYLTFLEEVGNGSIGGMEIYTGLVSTDAIYPTLGAKLSHIQLFGDDYQRYCYGFDTKHQYRLVEVDPWGEVHELDAPFETFIQRHVD